MCQLIDVVSSSLLQYIAHYLIFELKKVSVQLQNEHETYVSIPFDCISHTLAWISDAILGNGCAVKE